jgi:hypothetical protein
MNVSLFAETLYFLQELRLPCPSQYNFSTMILASSSYVAFLTLR